MELIAQKDFFDVASGKHMAGEVFIEQRPKVANQLLRSGLARVLTYETKIIVPEVPAVSAQPFRDVSHVDAEPPAVAPEGDSVLPSADVPEQGTAGDSGRGECSGPVAERGAVRTPRGKGKRRAKA